jgi:type IX secretion system PorP/SprF family membrane protein
MKTFNKYILQLGIVIFGFNLHAQQEAQFTQFNDNTLFINPAYAGSREMLNFTAMHREQWVGFDGAPRSTTFSAHSPLRYESVGLGFTAVNDRVGPMNQTMIYADFSYTVRFSKKRKLSFGLKGGFNMINLTTSSLVTTDQNDPKLTQNTVNNINPNFGAGIYYHSPRFFIGASTPKFIEQSLDGTRPTNLERRHLYGIIGGIIPVSADWKLRPSGQIKMTTGAPISLDLSLAGIYADKLWLGALYRHNAALGAYIQYQITNQFKIGIASDFGTQAMRNYNNGTFEVLMSYDMNFRKDGIRSPRYF